MEPEDLLVFSRFFFKVILSFQMEAEMISFALLAQQTKPTQVNVKVLDVEERNFSSLLIFFKASTSCVTSLRDSF